MKRWVRTNLAIVMQLSCSTLQVRQMPSYPPPPFLLLPQLLSTHERPSSSSTTSLLCCCRWTFCRITRKWSSIVSGPRSHCWCTSMRNAKERRTHSMNSAESVVHRRFGHEFSTPSTRCRTSSKFSNNNSRCRCLIDDLALTVTCETVSTTLSIQQQSNSFILTTKTSEWSLPIVGDALHTDTRFFFRGRKVRPPSQKAHVDRSQKCCSREGGRARLFCGTTSTTTSTRGLFEGKECRRRLHADGKITSRLYRWFQLSRNITLFYFYYHYYY